MDDHQPIEPRNRKAMNDVAEVLAHVFTDQGFVLLVFPLNDGVGRMNYISNAERDDVIKAMVEFIAHSEGRFQATLETRPAAEKLSTEKVDNPVESETSSTVPSMYVRDITALDEVEPFVDAWIRQRGTSMDGQSYIAALQLAAYVKAALAAATAVTAEERKIGVPDIILTGAQLLEALDFIAPDRATDLEQLEAKVAIQYGEGHGGKAYYVWCAEYPEEGSFVLDGSSANVAPSASTDAAAAEPVAAIRDRARCFVRDFSRDVGFAMSDARTEVMLNLFLRYAAPPAASGQKLTDAARDVLAERERQVTTEGWTTAHDDEHDSEEMAIAAACYAESAGGFHHPSTVPSNWPWTSKWWKPTTPRRDLVKAGALILAEIERLDRASSAAASDKEDQ
ncbi:hypothetical protein BCAR13_110078 [Paraburkholderia caribensis]|uniref:hypothetical protein n=1 Tax=Paraburkholderia caribensis TaxID=75105 RepID=UPI001CB0E000|nr:hypothetical protein [Paraburkholderia caribensis]CAG9193979.1 hypothetical protein BCAR13_110078 [Paraburkholderia caribensis]